MYNIRLFIEAEQDTNLTHIRLHYAEGQLKPKAAGVWTLPSTLADELIIWFALMKCADIEFSKVDDE